jgi:hypothetical protein
MQQSPLDNLLSILFSHVYLGFGLLSLLLVFQAINFVNMIETSWLGFLHDQYLANRSFGQSLYIFFGGLVILVLFLILIVLFWPLAVTLEIIEQNLNY